MKIYVIVISDPYGDYPDTILGYVETLEEAQLAVKHCKHPWGRPDFEEVELYTG